MNKLSKYDPESKTIILANERTSYIEFLIIIVVNEHN